MMTLIDLSIVKDWKTASNAGSTGTLCRRGGFTLQNNVCAVVVTFRLMAEHLENLIKARAQVQKLVVVDNGSSEQALAPFRGSQSQADFHLIENGENVGIAAALNIGIKWAQAQGCDWVILFDQDSTVT